jgi:virginiamycin B lyase
LEPTVAPTPTIYGPAPNPTAAPATVPPVTAYTYQEWDVPAGTHPHDVAPHPDGSVWYTGQRNGTAGRLDPATGDVTEMDLPAGAAPHGIIVGPDGAVWITDQGINALIRIMPDTLEMTVFDMPAGINASPHTPAIDVGGVVWFTGNNGYIGRFDQDDADVQLFDAPQGPGPYGIDVTPDNEVWYVSLDQSYLGRFDRTTAETELFIPPTIAQGARRVWSDSTSRLWLTEWNAGKLAMYDPASAEWREWDMPGDNPMPYAVYVDELDLVWVTDFDSNSIVRFDPATESFHSFQIPTQDAAVRQLLGREGELWGAESATDKVVVLRW